MRKGIGLYEGRKLSGLNARAYTRDSIGYVTDSFDDLWWNIPRIIAQAVEAKVSARHKPKAQVMTTDADWSMKRRAKKMDRYGEAVMHEQQGRYRNVWELSRRVFRDCMQCGIGYGKVIADPDDRKVIIERVLPWQVLVDPEEAEYGSPQNAIHRYAFEADSLIAQYPGMKREIEEAPEPDEDLGGRAYRADERLTDQRQVHEIWRLPIGSNPGKHMIVCGKAILEMEDWELDDFPVEVMRWDSEAIGWGATSLMEELRGPCWEMNFTLQRMQEAERKVSNGAILAPRGSFDQEDLTHNDIGRIMEYDPREGKVDYFAPKSYSESTIEFLNLNKSIMFEIARLSERSITGRRNPGVTAAIAMRTEDDMDTESLSRVFDMYEQWHVGVFKKVISQTRRMVEATGEEVIAKWPGQNFLREIRAQDWLDLEESKYTIMVSPVSGTKNTPAARLQLAEELFGSGRITPEAYARITEHLDPQSELRKNTKQHDWLEKEMDRWLDVDPDELEDGEFQYPVADKFLSVPDAQLQVLDALFDARIDEAPEYIEGIFLDFMAQLDRIASEQQAIAMQAQKPQEAIAAAPDVAVPAQPPAAAPMAAE